MIAAPIYWILRGHEPVAAGHDEWMAWMLSEPQTIAGFNRLKRVGRRVKVADAEVSTVFLSLDHNWRGGQPILFETMIFGGDFDGWQDRYHTWAEAAAGHRRVVAALRAGRDPDDSTR